jgi:flagellar hook-associated protein 1 FlgK
MSANSIANSAFAALQSAQAGMSLTSQNVGGQSDASYVKRRAELGTVRAVPNGLPDLGTAISVSGFTRDWSALLQQKRNQQAGVTAYHGAITGALSGLDSEVADPAVALDKPANDFFTSLAALGRNPSDKSALQMARSQATALLASAAHFDASLKTVQSDARANTEGSVTALNDAASELALLNRSIQGTVGGNAVGLDPGLLDRRDALLMKVSQLGGGDVSVSADGQAQVFLDGQPLVAGAIAGRLVLKGGGQGADQPVSLVMRFGLPGSDVAMTEQPIATDRVGGALGGQIVLGRSPSPVLEPDGQPDAKLQGLLDLMGAAQGTAPAAGGILTQTLARVGAANLRLEGASQADADTALKNLAIEANRGDAGNKLSALQDGLLTSWRGFSANLGAQVSLNQAAQSASEAVEGHLDASFQSQSGVNLDEEAANLLRYQQVYAAASRILQSNFQMLDQLMAVTGR